MTSSIKYLALAALLAGTAAAPLTAAQAEAAAPRTQEMTVQNAFEMVDTNGSQTIEKDEYDEFAENQGRAGVRLSKSFANLDADNDGTLSIEEFSKQSVAR